MTIEKNVNGTTAVWKLSGWLDTQSAPELEAELNALPSDITELVFDCTGLEYISSAGLRQFVSAYKKTNGHLIIRHVSDENMHVIKMTGLDKQMHFE